jgi:carbonic anhydrase
MAQLAWNKGFRMAAVVTGMAGALCAMAVQAEGVRQSPINIATAKVIKAKKQTAITPNLASDTTIDVVNTYNAAGPLDKEWATLKANVPAGSSVSVNGAQFNLLQFHFHSPSEHAVNGKRTAMEVHFVFLREGAKPCERKPDALMVIGARIVPGAPNSELGKIFDAAALPDNSAAPHLAVPHFDLNNVLASLHGSWRYRGSLTAPASFAPTCDEPEGSVAHQLETGTLPENVSWVLLARSISMSNAQIAAFHQLFPEGNSREVMPLKGRKVIRFR